MHQSRWMCLYLLRSIPRAKLPCRIVQPCNNKHFRTRFTHFQSFFIFFRGSMGSGELEEAVVDAIGVIWGGTGMGDV